MLPGHVLAEAADLSPPPDRISATQPHAIQCATSSIDKNASIKRTASVTRGVLTNDRTAEPRDANAARVRVWGLGFRALLGFRG